MSREVLDVVIRFHDVRRIVELDRCIFSIACQSYAPVIAHVVCQRFSNQDLETVSVQLQHFRDLAPELTIKVHNMVDPEPRDARSLLINKGISEAKGRYLAFLDYDDVTYPEGYRTLIGELASTDYAIAFGNIRSAYVSVDGDIFLTLTKKSVFHGNGVVDQLRQNFCPIHSFVLDRKRISAEDLYFEPNLNKHEDYDFLIRICSKYLASFNKRSRFVGEYHKKDDGSNTILVSSSATEESRREWERADEFLEERRRTTLVSPEVQRVIGISQPDPSLTVAALIEKFTGSPSNLS
ncbi:glycosyltransferase family A protein [Microvirga arsenatis]|uniref:Glycosyltransferase n=1 Tax=Microvirga arsenatis TaxID=2692265 RepID=A0ABW9YZ66_9HYPH|nr:glycosyltransferase family 2 protein [Microvirga arsenatis]NBJ11434.1 glycosyltransferase [Microvirga arsenatis]NBJ25707.1 glycosyltransferase [Microvirga arsenatis]